MERFVQDLRYAFRAFAKSPGFVAVAVITLGLGIGVDTVIFSVVNTMLIRPFPYREPDRLVGLRETKVGQNPCDQCSLSYANFADWRAQSKTLAGAAAYQGRSFNLAAPGEEPEQLEGEAVNASTFRV